MEKKSEYECLVAGSWLDDFFWLVGKACKGCRGGGVILRADHAPVRTPNGLQLCAELRPTLCDCVSIQARTQEGEKLIRDGRVRLIANP